MHDPRFDHDIVRLPDGRVLVAGGSTDPVRGEYGALASAEIYDPVADTWTLLPPMHDRRRAPTLAILSDGVYVAGGSYTDTTAPLSAVALASVERLSWQELGITPPVIVEEDAGVGDADAQPNGSVDAGSPDAADSAVDAADAAVDVAVDATVGGGGGRGCACSMGSMRGERRGEAAMWLLLAWAAAATRARKGRPRAGA